MKRDANVARLIGKRLAMSMVAGRTDKPGGVDPAAWFRDDPEDALYALGSIPLSAFAANQNGQLYDGTVGVERALGYASRAGYPPPVLACFGRRDSTLRILDGGHRISAARMANKEALCAIVRLKPSQIESLIEHGQGELARLGWTIDLPRGRAKESGPIPTSGIAQAQRARDDGDMEVFQVYYQSRNFLFEAYGRSEKEARLAFIRGIDAHIEVHKGRVAPDWKVEVLSNLEVREMQMGACYRDGYQVAAAQPTAEATPAKVAKAKREQVGPIR